MAEEEKRVKVHQGYVRIAVKQNSGCGCNTSCEESKKVGCSKEDLEAVPEGENMGLGYGNVLRLLCCLFTL